MNNQFQMSSVTSATEFFSTATVGKSVLINTSKVFNCHNSSGPHVPNITVLMYLLLMFLKVQ